MMASANCFNKMLKLFQGDNKSCDTHLRSLSSRWANRTFFEMALDRAAIVL